VSNQRKFQPFVPENLQMREFTLRALLLGLVMTVILGAANAYLGLRAGITIAATYCACSRDRFWKKTSPEPPVPLENPSQRGPFSRYPRF
jgi:hypothetical protein